VPILTAAINVELGCVLRIAQREMSFVAANIIDAMRYDFTVREARKVVIKTSSLTLT